MANLVRTENLALFFREIVEEFKKVVTVVKNNTVVGIKKRLNFQDSNNVSWTITDNPSTKSIDISASVVAGTATLADGDYGDITVGGGGTTMTLDPGIAVPPSRLINTTSPITGGGSLAADLTLGFDMSNLDNNARVRVDKNGVNVGNRREINFIEGTNITLTVVDDNPNEKVDITIDASGGGGSGLTHSEVMSRILQMV